MRKTAEVVISAAGRDKGKKFLLTEMSAFDGERWAARALGILARTQMDIPVEAILTGGWQALAAYGVKAALMAMGDDAFPLLDEMDQCIQTVEPKAGARVLVKDSDIEEVATILLLRDEVLRLHTGFSIRAALSKEAAQIKAAIDNISNTQTAPTLSEPVSPFG